MAFPTMEMHSILSWKHLLHNFHAHLTKPSPICLHFAQIMFCLQHIAFQVRIDHTVTPTPSLVARKDTPPHLPSTPGQTALTFGESPTAKVITPRLALTKGTRARLTGRSLPAHSNTDPQAGRQRQQSWNETAVVTEFVRDCSTKRYPPHRLPPLNTRTDASLSSRSCQTSIPAAGTPSHREHPTP